MAEFLVGAAAFILAMVALGLLRILRGPGDADRIMAAQLLGTGGIAAVLLLGAASGEAAIFRMSTAAAQTPRMKGASSGGSTSPSAECSQAVHSAAAITAAMPAEVLTATVRT